jgi:hypothetical protein
VAKAYFAGVACPAVFVSGAAVAIEPAIHAIG